MSTFLERIIDMNRRYELPINDCPTLYDESQFDKFQDVIMEEAGEIQDIPLNGEVIQKDGENVTIDELDVLTGYADLLADIIVYCTSEAVKFGIPLVEVLDIVMDSNESKLAEDGTVIKDERGKFLKGPNYWAPEDKIKALLHQKQQDCFKSSL